LNVAVKEIKPEEDAQEVADHWEREVAALRTMNELKQKHIVRFLTAFRRYTDHQRPEHYLIFEWADGGNLRNLWKRHHSPKLTGSLIKEVIQQILGLATALEAAHNLNNHSGASYRHGDLKPENILVFENGREIGDLKIGDWGEARYQGVRTEMRPSGSKSRFGTVRYEAPEVKTGIQENYIGQRKERRSRLYDIWALGCISLEFFVWLLEGWDGLQHFNMEITGDDSFYQITPENGKNVAHVHRAAVRCMDRLAQHPACNSSDTAIGRLLELIRTSLLVVKLPRTLGTSGSMPTPRQSERQRLDFFLTPDGERTRLQIDMSVKTTSSSGLGHQERGQWPTTLPYIPTIDNQEQPSLVPKSPDSHVRSAIKGIPMFEFTPADADPEPEPHKISDKMPIPRRPELKGDRRGLSDEICKKLDDILTEDDAVGYWNPDQTQRVSSAVGPSPASSTPLSDTRFEMDVHDLQNALENESKVSFPQCVNGFYCWFPRASLTHARTEQVDYNPPILDPNDWKLQYNNHSASSLLESLAATDPSDFPASPPTSELCKDCSKYSQDLLNPGFSWPYDVSELERRAQFSDCNLCKLLWRTCVRNGGHALESGRFDRTGPSLRMDNNSNKNVLSVVRLPTSDNLTGIESQAVYEYQVGFVELPVPGGPTHLGMVQKWLSHCDQTHHKCRTSGRTVGSNRRLPTRLIDVMDNSSDTVRLWETSDEDKGDWIALSHQWGKITNHFSTTRANLQEHLQGIRFSDLPATFRDAVTVTRAIGHRYLWIDSLCIIQGPNGDFETEAQKMEAVYSGAYCVIAASCAANHHDGFLKPRDSRDYVGFIPEGRSKAPVYICQHIDNFKQHVSDGSLNRRGWVLQEHALARRTISFTKHQTYFECSHGIRCETSTKMQK
jgi:serine/threonine protein kinase